MDRYTIYCTEEQTKKALELGAPIMLYKDIATESAPKGCFIEDNTLFFIPTAEQMISWLEERSIAEIVISRKMSPHTFGFNIWYGMDGLIQGEKQYPSRKEATLAAIDVALDYLIKNKK